MKYLVHQNPDSKEEAANISLNTEQADGLKEARL